MTLIDKKVDRRIFALAIPAIGEMLSNTIVWTADTAMVGRLTAADIAGVNLGAQMMFTLSNIMSAIGIGATALVARNIGAKDTERAEYIAGLALSIGIIAAFIIGVLGIVFAESIFGIIVDDPDVISIGSNYSRIVFVGAFFVIPMIISNSIIRATGNTVIPMVAAMTTNITNIVGDYVLIFGKFGLPALGANGAAIATAGSQAVGFMICLTYLIKGSKDFKLRRRNMFNFKREPMKTLIDLSIPAGMETFMNEGSRLLSSFWIAQLGTVAFAANSLAVAAESLSFMPGNGFAVAAAALVGQSLGAGDYDMAEKVAKRSVFYAALMMGLVGLAFFFFPYAIMSFFSTDMGSVLEASKAIRVGAFEQIPIAIAMVMSGALKGAGDTKGPFRIFLVTNFMFRLPLIFAIVFLIKGRISHVWAATAVQYAVEATLMIIRYRRGHWRRIEIR
ncbi:MATE family efflux transporter [Lutispora thermophila]|uniref:Probable multidrug resistance protein NorM n=1 Tax=Lutispora thermophila DSM 19022 TaxID=1122184 RepID=A0A1M6GCH3_9FIRM|nr:MATE family efflux transporter [Lutispora thermophila]SHJ07678.1 putative efflux protein, MATE family [Lutispora thermophila DSM 19022]